MLTKLYLAKELLRRFKNLIPKDKMIMASVEASQLKLGKLEAIIKTNLKSFRQNLDLEQNKGISL